MKRQAVALDEAIRRIGPARDIHTFRTRPNILLGCDWDREEVIAYMRKHGVEESGPIMSGMKHTLVANVEGDDPLFIETESGPLS
jgi:hypothetical protein